MRFFSVGIGCLALMVGAAAPLKADLGCPTCPPPDSGAWRIIVRPNPYRGVGPVEIQYAGGNARERVRFVVYNVRGGLVRVVTEGEVSPVPPTLERVIGWDGRDDFGRELPRGNLFFVALERIAVARRRTEVVGRLASCRLLVLR